MLTEHGKASIAQVVFWAPAVIPALILLFHRHGAPRMPWVILVLFALIRITCGIVVIVLQNRPQDVGLIIAAHVLLNAGVFPLVAAAFGLLLIVIIRDFPDDKRIRNAFIFLRVVFITGISLVIAGGCLESNYWDPHDVSLGYKLTKAGYILVTIFEASLIYFQWYCWRKRETISVASCTALQGMFAAVPFLIIRIAYLYLPVFRASDPKWDQLTGSIAPYVVMGLLMEYIVFMIFLATGFLIPPIKVVNA
ncbi:hypothetical protein BDV26DRAFT_292613 [Aspergillus bertholletiae]|uniref:DUF7702 domain-containing protein n=1 Tax=Aspergillus bertholletiae TaxID=1226010 RepID=A0A5N7B8E2_9EURO|nr:hypothetical protein BDV26DRAFT_292613 [Aspergillus bertholletiae]